MKQSSTTTLAGVMLCRDYRCMKIPPIHLSDAARVLAAIKNAPAVSATAFVLAPDGGLVAALVDAAHRGARVDVSLADDKFAKPLVGAENEQSAQMLRDAGAHVYFDRRFSGQAPLHMKSVIANGTAFLDDRNWTLGDDETIVETNDPADVALIRRGQFFHGGENGDLATRKDAALRREVDVIAHAAGHTVDIETESFSAKPIVDAICARAARGDTVRVIVVTKNVANTEAQAALARLRAAHVGVHGVGGGDPKAGAEKMALGADAAWMGSANATSNPGDMVDWGMTTREAALRKQLEVHFERAWSASPAL